MVDGACRDGIADCVFRRRHGWRFFGARRMVFPGSARAKMGALRWSPIGGALGAAGSLLSSPAGPPSGLFVIWQTGMAALLGLFSLSLTAARSATAQSSSRTVKRTFPTAYKLFLVLLVVWPAYFLIRRISADHSAQHR